MADDHLILSSGCQAKLTPLSRHDLLRGMTCVFDRFYEAEMIHEQLNVANGPIKTFTLRGIKDSPPNLHDQRLMTLEDTVGFSTWCCV